MGAVFHFTVVSLLTPFITSFAASDPLIITTARGQVQGKLVPVQHSQVRAFLGIPYGKAPVGKLRFRAPVPADGWQGVKNATEFPKACYQPLGTTPLGFRGIDMWIPNTPLSEDCLYLNVWTPHVRKKTQSSPLPVMVWIYGGAYVIGTSSLDQYDGRYLAYYEDVVVVSMNYRLGAFGFLSLPDNENVRGNAGLLDQRLAIQWVVNNIAAFGGDPSQVTLFGESAGSQSVAFHVLSPGSRDLFQRAVLQSGVPTAAWSSTTLAEAWRRSTKLGTLLGCPTLDSIELEACLQEADVHLVALAQFGLNVSGIQTSPFLPVIDGTILPDTVEALINDDSVPKKDLLMGFTRDEGSLFIMLSGVPGFDLGPSLITREQFLYGLGLSFPRAHRLVKEAVVHEYTDWTDEKNCAKNRDALNEFISDYLFICPAQDFAHRYAQAGGNLYMYYFTHPSSVNPWPEWMGVMHAYEIEFVFGLPLNPSLGYSEEEMNMSRRIMKHWANFARTGNPSIDKDKWPLFTPENREYITLNTSLPEKKTKLKAKKCHFWSKIFPQMMSLSDAVQACGRTDS